MLILFQFAPESWSSWSFWQSWLRASSNWLGLHLTQPHSTLDVRVATSEATTEATAEALVVKVVDFMANEPGDDDETKLEMLNWEKNQRK